jgi:hypothetical protein
MCDTDLDLDLDFAEDEQALNLGQDPAGEYAGVAWGLAGTTADADAEPAKSS